MSKFCLADAVTIERVAQRICESVIYEKVFGEIPVDFSTGGADFYESYGYGSGPDSWTVQSAQADWRTGNREHRETETVDNIDDPKNWPGLYDTKRKPNGDYICHNCFKENDHFVQDCPRLLPPDYKLTPYQGHKPSVGEFFCDKCKRWWVSRKSFVNMPEECRKCGVNCFPKKQYSHELAERKGVFDKKRYQKNAARKNSVSDAGTDEDDRSTGTSPPGSSTSRSDFDAWSF